MNREALINLRRILSQLFDDPQTIRRILADAGINGARINLRGAVQDVWHEVLAEAARAEHLDALIQIAGYEYPNRRAELQKWLAATADQVSSSPADAMSGASSSSPLPSAQSTAQSAEPSVADDNNSRRAPASSLTGEQASTTTATTSAREVPLTAPRSIRLSSLETKLLSTLFHRASRLAVKSEFSEGRSDTRVFLVQPTDNVGRLELPAVAKVGPAVLIAPEWEAAEKHILDHFPGFVSVHGTPIYLTEAGSSYGALRYQQVGDGIFPVETLVQYSGRFDGSLADLYHVWQERLFPQLNAFWQSSQNWQAFRIQQSYDAVLPVNLLLTPLPMPSGTLPGLTGLDGAQEIPAEQTAGLQRGMLVQLSNFVITELTKDYKTITLDRPPGANGLAKGYRLRLQREEGDPQLQLGAPYPPTVAVIATTRQDELQERAQSPVGATVNLCAATVTMPEDGAITLPNPLPVLPALLARQSEGWFATIHGDLNLCNILIETHAHTTHIIDCAKAHYNHILHDPLRMERDIVLDILPPIFFRAQLPVATIVRFYQQLHCALLGPAHPAGEFALPADLPAPLIKPFVLIVTIRQNVRSFLPEQQWESYHLGLILHLIGALKFRNLDTPTPGHKPKALAFWAAATVLDLVQNPARARELYQAMDWKPFNVATGDNRPKT